MLPCHQQCLKVKVIRVATMDSEARCRGPRFAWTTTEGGNQEPARQGSSLFDEIVELFEEPEFPHHGVPFWRTADPA